MRIPRLFIPDRLDPGGRLSLAGESAHYLLRVLRLGPGAEVVLFNGDGHDFGCRLVEAGRESALLEVIERRRNTAESPLRITLSQALSRGERMDYCLQKATELGVAAVQILQCERVEVRLDGASLEKRLDHWRKVMRSASEQCGRATVPTLRAPMPLSEWARTEGLKLVLDADAGLPMTGVGLGTAVDIAVGPEGGFSETEIASMTEQGVRVVSLGPRVLRTETAGPAAIAVLQSMAGDFR